MGALKVRTGPTTFAVVGGAGTPGPTGPGVATGGTVGQVLTKIDSTNYNTQWTTPTAGGLDQTAADARYVNVTGDTLSGALVVNSSIQANYIHAPGGAIDGLLMRSSQAAPLTAEELTRKDYVDAQVATRLTQAAADTRYVNVDGDAMTGTLTTTADVVQTTSGSKIVGRTLRAVNGGSVSHGVQMLMGYNGTENNSQAIETLHSGSTIPGNSMRFRLWQPGDVHTAPTNTVLTLAGDLATFTKPVVLPAADPTLSEHAVRKAYVDWWFVQKAGDTMTGHLTLPASDPPGTYSAVHADYMFRWINLSIASQVPSNLLYDVVPVANRWVTSGGAGTTTALTAGWVQFIPVRCPPCTINTLGVEVTSASTATSLRLGIYSTHPTLVQPYTRLVDAGLTVDAAVGFKSVALGTPVSWPGGLMWLAVVANGGGCTLRATTGFGEPWIMFDVAQTPPNLTYRSWTSSIGQVSLPATLSATLNVATDGNPRVAFKTV